MGWRFLGGDRECVGLTASPAASAECLDGLGGVVLAAGEASVDRLLDAVPGRLEQGGHHQGGPSDYPARRRLPHEHVTKDQHGVSVHSPRAAVSVL
jgi:hypothetical protein